MTKYPVLPKFGNYKVVLTMMLIFAMVVLTFVPVTASAADKEQVVAKRAQWNLRIAEKQYDRGLYKEAELTLVQVKQSLSKMSISDKGRYNSLNNKIHAAMDERREVLSTLKLSDDLEAQGQYIAAIEELRSIRNSKALTAAEKDYVNASIANLQNQSGDGSKTRVSVNNTKVIAISATDDVEDLILGEASVTRSGTVVTPGNIEITTIEIIPIGPEDTVDTAVADVDKVIAIEPVNTEVAVIEVPVPQDASSVQSDQIDITPVVKTAEPAVGILTQGLPDAEKTYITIIEEKRNRQVSYTKAILIDAIKKANAALAENDFSTAKQSVATALSVVNKNKLLLGDQLYGEYDAQLAQLEDQIVTQENEYAANAETRSIKETENLQRTIRDAVQKQRAEAIVGYLEGAYAFQKQQRYTEALGQLEQILVLEPHHDEALRLKMTLEDTVRWRTQLAQIKESNDEEMDLLLKTGEKAIPYSDEINYPKDWKAIIDRRKAQEDEGRDPRDIEVYKSLNKIVDLSALMEDTTLQEAIESIIANSVEPPLQIFVDWNNLTETAFIDKQDAIGVSGRSLTSVQLKTGLDRVLRSAGDELSELGYVVSDGIVTVAMKDSLPVNLETKVYDIREIISAQTMGGGMGGGSMGGMSGGMGGGSMGGMGGGGMGGGSMGGGSMGGGSMGGGSMGGGSMGGMSGGMGGGGMGGGSMGGGSMGGGSMGGGGVSYQSRRKLYELVGSIVDIDVESWDENTVDNYGSNNNSTSGGGLSSTTELLIYGEGTIRSFADNSLIIKQTPEMHEKIKALMKKLLFLTDDQVSIETRFIVVDENFLEDIGIDVNIRRLKIGGPFEIVEDVVSGSYDHTQPRGTSISSTLGNISSGAAGSAMGFDLRVGGGAFDDLAVDFIVRATEAHANAKTLTAPKVTVINGEQAMINVTTETNYVSNIEFNQDSQSGDGVNTTSAGFTNEIDSITSGIMMSVTPTITSDKKYVILSINTNLTDVDLSGLQGETTGVINGVEIPKTFDLPKQQMTVISTRATVPDMGTVLLGGLTLTAERQVESGVPILGKIPFLQRFFSNRSEVKDKQILLILVRPTIILKSEAEEDAVAALSR